MIALVGARCRACGDARVWGGWAAPPLPWPCVVCGEPAVWPLLAGEPPCPCWPGCVQGRGRVADAAN